MVLTLRPSKIERKRTMLDVREAFNLWDCLKLNYDAVEKLEVYTKFAHDKDLIFFINSQLKEIKYQNNNLINLMRLYAINGPDRGREGSQWVGNQEAFRDEFIFQEFLIAVQERAEKLLYVSRTCLTNDEIRNFFVVALKTTLETFDVIYKYGKLKGWIGIPPLYLNVSLDVQEKISCSTVACIWDMLTFRYDNMRQTQILYAFANDGDFKLIITMGLDILMEQISKLERECKYFGVSLPKRPPEIIAPSEDTGVFTDDHIYRMILSGMQGAGSMHTIALKQCIFNDRFASLFKTMLSAEIGYYEKLVKYGKLKGWLHPSPKYKA